MRMDTASRKTLGILLTAAMMILGWLLILWQHTDIFHQTGRMVVMMTTFTNWIWTFSSIQLQLPE